MQSNNGEIRNYSVNSTEAVNDLKILQNYVSDVLSTMEAGNDKKSSLSLLLKAIIPKKDLIIKNIDFIMNDSETYRTLIAGFKLIEFELNNIDDQDSKIIVLSIIEAFNKYEYNYKGLKSDMIDFITDFINKLNLKKIKKEALKVEIEDVLSIFSLTILLLAKLDFDFSRKVYNDFTKLDNELNSLNGYKESTLREKMLTIKNALEVSIKDSQPRYEENILILENFNNKINSILKLLKMDETLDSVDPMIRLVLSTKPTKEELLNILKDDIIEFHQYICQILIGITTIANELEKRYVESNNNDNNNNNSVASKSEILSQINDINNYLADLVQEDAIRSIYLTENPISYERTSLNTSLIHKAIVYGATRGEEENQNIMNIFNREILHPFDSKQYIKLRRYFIDGKYGKLETYTYKFGDKLAKDTFHIIYFFGNGGAAQTNIIEMISYIKLIAERNPSYSIQITAFNYYGYMYSENFPDSMAKLKESGMTQIYDLLKRGVKGEGIFLFGQSLGGAIATLVAAQAHQEGIKVSLINCRSFAQVSKFISSNSIVTTIASAATNFNDDILSAFNSIPSEYKDYIVSVNDGVIAEQASLFKALEENYEKEMTILQKKAKQARRISRGFFSSVSDYDDDSSPTLSQALKTEFNNKSNYEAAGFKLPNIEWVFYNPDRENTEQQKRNLSERERRIFIAGGDCNDSKTHNTHLSQLVSKYNHSLTAERHLQVFIIMRMEKFLTLIKNNNANPEAEVQKNDQSFKLK